MLQEMSSPSLSSLTPAKRSSNEATPSNTLEGSEAKKHQRRRRGAHQSDEEEQMQLGSSSDVVPTLSSSSALSTAQCCYDDALLYLFKFLTLRDLTPAARSCRRWWQAALKEKPRLIDFAVTSTDMLSNLSASVQRRHVTNLKCMDFEDEWTVPVGWHVNDLMLIRDRLPQLTQLETGVTPSSLHEILQRPEAKRTLINEGCFSNQLFKLTLNLRDPAHSAASTQLVLELLPACVALVDLNISVHFSCAAELRFNSFLQLVSCLRLRSKSSSKCDLSNI